MARRPTYLGLQVLRVMAAVLVLITHSGFYVSERLDHSFKYWRTGAAGVDLFFVISGFVMVYSSINLIGDSKGWLLFSERRIIRIVPMYWLATTIKLVLMVLAGEFVLHARFSPFDTIMSYLFLPTRNSDGNLFPLLGVGWTLNFEMLFYMLFAVALFLRVSVFRFVGTVLVLLAAGALLRQDNWPAFSFYLNPIVLDFFFGMLVAGACLQGKHLPRGAAVLSVLAGLLLLLVFPATIGHTSLAGLAATMIVGGVVGLEAWLIWIPAWLIYLADASYVIYLFHPLVAPAAPALLLKLNMPYPLLSITLSSCSALLAGCLIHKLVEKPVTLRLKRALEVRSPLRNEAVSLLAAALSRN
jgi:exopolysaccharide production protein ExoZ